MKIFEGVWLRSVLYGMALLSLSCDFGSCQSMSGPWSEDEYGLTETEKHAAPESSLSAEEPEDETMDYWSPEEEEEETEEEKNYDDGQLFVRGSRSYHQLLRNLRNGAIKAPSSTLEYPVYREEDRDEPSCEELRAIWRLTKRAARQSLLTNEIPKHPTNFYGYVAYNGGVGEVALPEGQAFGRIVTEPHNKLSPHPKPYRTPHFGSYDRVEEQLRRGMFAEKPYKQLGTGKLRTKAGVGRGSSLLYSTPYYVRPHQTALSTSSPIKSSKGSSVIQVALNKHGGSVAATSTKSKPYYNGGKYGTRRSSSSSPLPSVVYGVYSNQGGVTTDENLASSSAAPPPPPKSSFKSRIHIKEPRKIPHRDMLMAADQGYGGNHEFVDSYQPQPLDSARSEGSGDIPRKFLGRVNGFSNDNSGCQNIQSKKCQKNEDCSCYGFYGCVYGKCKTYTSNTKLAGVKDSKSSQGWWHDGSVSKETPPPSARYSLLKSPEVNSPGPQFNNKYSIPNNREEEQEMQGEFVRRQKP